MDVADALLTAVLLDSLRQTALGHLLNAAHAEFQLVSQAWIQVDHLLIERRLVYQPRLTAQILHRRIIGMQRQLNASRFSRREHIVQKTLQSIP